jgi:voltage-gated potassium channel
MPERERHSSRTDWNTLRLKVSRLVFLILAVLAFGTLGYRLILGWEWLDSLFMATITVTTVGYGEVHRLDPVGQVFTIVLLFISVGVFAYALSSLTSIVVEAQVGQLIARRRMEKRIAALKDHFILCGFGRTGQAVQSQLTRERRHCVVIEQDPGRLHRLNEQGLLHVEGDATRDDCLQQAGIHRARGLVAALGNDAENVYLVLSARQLSPKLTIVSWASSSEAEQKVMRAGADHTLSPYTLGGSRLAHLLLHPHTVEFLDHAMSGGDTIRMGEIHVLPHSKAVGASLMTLGVHRNLGVILIGVRHSDGKLDFNPPADQPFLADDILIGIGSSEQLDKLRKMF